MSWLVPGEELTPDQLRVVELDPYEHRLVVGPPGSGKTLVLLHRAAYLRDMFGVTPERFRIIVFTRTLRSYIESDLSLLDLPADNVSTFDAWCAAQYQQHIGGRLPWNAEKKERDYAAIRRAIRNWATVTLADPPLDFVLVDEGQDLTAEAFEILRMVSSHVTVCFDRKQQLYDAGADEAAILKALRIRKRNVGFLDAFRCAPYIARLAATLVDNAEERDAFLHQIRTTQAGRETPLLYYATDFEDERRRLIEVVRARVLNGERVGLLLPQKRQVAGFAAGLRAAGVDVEAQGERSDGDAARTPNFETDLPKVLTYHSAKGLTFDSVIMPRLVPSSFKGVSLERIRHLLFVGITRATQWVYLSTSEDVDFRAISTVAALADSGCVTVQGTRRQSRLFKDGEPDATDESPDLF